MDKYGNYYKGHIYDGPGFVDHQQHHDPGPHLDLPAKHDDGPHLDRHGDIRLVHIPRHHPTWRYNLNIDDHGYVHVYDLTNHKLDVTADGYAATLERAADIIAAALQLAIANHPSSHRRH